MVYIIKPRASRKISSFYKNVAKKYQHTYSLQQMLRNIDETVNSMYRIENGLQRTTPTILRWRNYYMANTKTWYFAYTFNEQTQTITIVDACHAQNMHEMRIQFGQIVLEVINSYFKDNLLIA